MVQNWKPKIRDNHECGNGKEAKTPKATCGNGAVFRVASGRESLLSLGIGRFDFHCHNQRWVCRQPESTQILVFQVQADRLLQIAGYLIQRRSLSDDGDFKALGHIAPVALRP